MTWSYCHHHHCGPDPKAFALDIQGVTAGYPGHDIPALKNVTVSIPAGASIALVGANGAGKSTLFKAVAGLLPVKSGRVRIFGHELGECHQRVVYLPQRSEIDWQFPICVLDLVLTGRYVYLGWFKRPGQSDTDAALNALDQLGIRSLAGRHISHLSGGQQQRVLIARALAQNADLLLLDEPLNAIDAETRQTVARVLDGIKAAGKTVVVATHSYDEGDGRFDGAIYLKDGEKIDGHDGPHHSHECGH